MSLNGPPKSAYVPPHLRNAQRQQQQQQTQTPPVSNGYVRPQISRRFSLSSLSSSDSGWTDSRPAPSGRGGGSFAPNSAFSNNRSSNSYSRGGGVGGSDTGSSRAGDWSSRGSGGNSGWESKPARSDRPSEGHGVGAWRDGKHIVGQRNPRLEKELYGEPDDPLKQHTGINFEKYEDIPVEATGAGVPDPVLAFTNPPLDPVLLENIIYARYTTPTPVQKYSIPIIAANRDLLACAQVCTAIVTFNLAHLFIRLVQERPVASFSQFCLPCLPVALVLRQKTLTAIIARRFRRRSSSLPRASWSVKFTTKLASLRIVRGFAQPSYMEVPISTSNSARLSEAVIC